MRSRFRLLMRSKIAVPAFVRQLVQSVAAAVNA
jgi:hypothetical protein